MMKLQAVIPLQSLTFGGPSAKLITPSAASPSNPNICFGSNAKKEFKRELGLFGATVGLVLLVSTLMSPDKKRIKADPIAQDPTFVGLMVKQAKQNHGLVWEGFLSKHEIKTIRDQYNQAHSTAPLSYTDEQIDTFAGEVLKLNPFESFKTYKNDFRIHSQVSEDDLAKLVELMGYSTVVLEGSE
jgi:hypothetical protein